LENNPTNDFLTDIFRTANWVLRHSWKTVALKIADPVG